ncbi:MAG TPA: HAD-IA family hydrolase [Candidatus Saccharimonadales bacterium]|nr:HAD-IA family hydrolase [Candidatus Saccharimonadales bacterium]
MIKTIIFDFDGTLADTRQIVQDIFNQLAPKYGFKLITDAEIENLRDHSAREFFKSLRVNPFKIPSLIKTAKAGMAEKIKYAKAFDGIAEMLCELKNLQFTLGVLTSNSVENVQTFLDNNKLTQLDFIDSENDLFGKDKALNALIKKFNLVKSEVIYVGDETRDIDACKKAGVKIIAVTWGFNSEKALNQLKPDFLINNPAELVEIVKEKIV